METQKINAEKILTFLVELYCDQYGIVPEEIKIIKKDEKEETA